MNASLDHLPMRISIIGGGRWARVIAQVLCGFENRPLVTMHSQSNSEGLVCWIASRNLGAAVKVTSDWPDFTGGGRPDAVIVANAAAKHFSAAMGALCAGVPALIEKPIAASHAEATQLMDTCRHGVILAASHVFLFSRYIDTFRTQLNQLGEATSYSVIWSDPQGETRYGEAKSYDPSLIITDDILPHVLPMMVRLTGKSAVFRSLSVERGGANVSLAFRVGDLPLTVMLLRDGEERRRRICVDTANGPCILDFSGERSTVLQGEVHLEGDPLRETAPGPLATMLQAFLSAASGSSLLDERLSPELARSAIEISDAVRGPYLQQQQQWLALHPHCDAAEGVAYARREIEARLSSV